MPYILNCSKIGKTVYNNKYEEYNKYKELRTNTKNFVSSLKALSMTLILINFERIDAMFNMFKWNDNFNLIVDCELFGNIQEMEENATMTLDDLHFTVLAMIGALAIKNPYAPCIYTTLDNILITMAQDMNFKAKPKIRNGLMNGFNTLRKYGLIKMSEMFTGDKKQLVSIDMHTLNHEKECNYFQLSRQELATIMKNSGTPHHLIVLLCNYCSRFNGSAYDSFYKGEWHKGYYDSGATLYKKLSCWASQDVLTTTWINSSGTDYERKNKWDVTQAMFSRYCNELVELKILDRYVVGFTGGRISYYFRPIHRDIFLWTIELLGKQQAYVVEQEEKETKDVKSSHDDEFEKKLAKLSSKVDYD